MCNSVGNQPANWFQALSSIMSDISAPLPQRKQRRNRRRQRMVERGIAGKVQEKTADVTEREGLDRVKLQSIGSGGNGASKETKTFMDQLLNGLRGTHMSDQESGTQTHVSIEDHRTIQEKNNGKGTPGCSEVVVVDGAQGEGGGQVWLYCFDPEICVDSKVRLGRERSFPLLSLSVDS